MVIAKSNPFCLRSKLWAVSEPDRHLASIFSVGMVWWGLVQRAAANRGGAWRVLTGDEREWASEKRRG
jgi:hypothetical protein